MNLYFWKFKIKTLLQMKFEMSIDKLDWDEFCLPEFDMSISSSDEIVSIFSEWNGLDLGADLVGGHFDVVPPIPDIDNQVLLRSNRNDVFVIRSKCLKYKQFCISIILGGKKNSIIENFRWIYRLIFIYVYQYKLFFSLKLICHNNFSMKWHN